MRPAIDLTRALAIKGFMHPTELQWLAERASEARVAIEVGSFTGRSTRALADHCPGVVYAVDRWDATADTEPGDRAAAALRRSGGDAVYAAFTQALADLIAAGRVLPLRLSARVASQWLVIAGLRADLVFLDGDHRDEACAADIHHFRPVLRTGGILAGHDYGHPQHPGVTRAVDAAFGADVATCRSIWWVRV